MKKLFALMAILLIPLVAMAVDPAHEGYMRSVGTVTVDSTFDGTYWEILGDGIVWVTTQVGTVTFNISGVALMDPGDKLWLGFGGDTVAGTSAAFAHHNTKDSMLIKHELWNKGRAYIPFSFSTVMDTIAATDTAYFLAACGGDGMLDPVQLYNVITSVTVIDSMLAF